MGILGEIWDFFATNILTQPAYFVGLMVFVGYILMGKKWYDVLAGVIKAIVGYFILVVGSSGLVSNFRPILVGLKDVFKIDVMVIDPYFGQNAVQAGVGKVFGRTFSEVMTLLLIAFIINIVLVRLKKFTKCRALFTTGHIQVQQASTAFWLILFALPILKNDIAVLIVMSIVLGLYWAVGSNLTVEPTQELTNGAGFCMAHQQQFGVFIFSKIAEKMGAREKAKGKESRRLEDIKLPGFMSIFNENMVCTSILMLIFFGLILAVLGKPYMVKAGFLKATDNYFFYIVTTCLYFSVYLSILQLGVRIFVTELTASFQGIADKLLPGSIPGVDCAVAFGFGSPNAVPIGFISGALGQFVAIITLLLLKSPTLVIAGFVPVFFDNATIGVFANHKGGAKAAIILPFFSGLVQVFGSAFIATFVGLSRFGGYLGMFDWATVWPIFTVVMKYLGLIGLALVVIFLILIPQLQYRANPEGYFACTEDYEKYAKLKGIEVEEDDWDDDDFDE